MQGTGRRLIGQKMKPYLMMAPMLVLALLFAYYPFATTLLQAFSYVDVRQRVVGFAGLENFKYLFSRSDFSAALSNTLLLTVMNVPLTLVLTAFLAALADKKRALSPVYEVLFSLPMAVAMSTAALIFKVMFNPSVGIINQALGIQCKWYEGRDTALYGILMLTIWMGIGYNYCLFLAAFRGVSPDLLQAAQLDGANSLQQLWYIKLPAAAPTAVYAACTNTVLCMMCSGPVLIMIKDSLKRRVSTLIYMMYASGYQSSDYGTAACVALVTFALTALFSLLILRFEKQRGEAA